MSPDFLEVVEQQLVAATERGISRRRWRWAWLTQARLPWRASTIGIGAGVGTALAASALAATLTLPASKPKLRTATAAATITSSVHSFTTAGAVPAGFQPGSFTAISELTWWLLGSAPCDGHTCTTIVRTTDGGRTFVRIPAPPTRHVANVRFANAHDGYAYGPQLWTTHNGGRTWAEPKLGAGTVAIGDGYAYALASSDAPAQRLMRTPIDRNAWAVPPGLSDRRWALGSQTTTALWVQGDTVIIQEGNRLLISNDQGDHFSRHRGVANAGDCSYDGGPHALWALCSTGMAPDEILLSPDLGNSFTTAAQVPNGPIGAFAAASGTVAVASGQGPLYRTADAGASWTPVDAPSAGWSYLGFTDSTHGVAIGNFGSGGHQQTRLYYTTDAGASYHLVPFGS